MLVTGHSSLLKWLGRFRLRHLGSALLAGPSGVVVPKIKHRLAEVLHDVAAIEINVFHERPAILAIKNDMFVLAGRTAALDHHAKRVRRPHRRVRNIWRNEEGFTFTHEMIHDPIAFADAHFDVALQLVEIFFRIDEMKIVPRVRAFNDHDEKVATVIKVLIADRRFKLFPVRLDPVLQINRRLHGAPAAIFG